MLSRNAEELAVAGLTKMAQYKEKPLQRNIST